MEKVKIEELLFDSKEEESITRTSLSEPIPSQSDPSLPVSSPRPSSSLSALSIPSKKIKKPDNSLTTNNSLVAQGGHKRKGKEKQRKNQRTSQPVLLSSSTSELTPLAEVS